MDSSDFNEELYREEWRWQEGDLTVTRSTQWSAPGCHNGCSILLYTDRDGKLVKVEGDPQSTYTQGRLCMRCFALPEGMYHEKRITRPMKRAREDRGKDKWEEISWDEAYDLFEENVRRIWKEDGTGRGIAVTGGTGRNMMWHKLVAAYGMLDSPNVLSGFLSGDACYNPRIFAMQGVVGGCLDADVGQFFPDHFDNPKAKVPDLIVVWGCDPLISNADGFFAPNIMDCLKLGSKLIVVDHRVTWLGAHAEVLARIRPGTDAAFAMGVCNVMIKEDLYDHDFVDRWCYGFDELAERVSEWTPEKVAEVCWCDPETVVSFARTWATAGTSTLKWGLVLDQSICGVGAAHAVMCAEAMTGSIEQPGGFILATTGKHVDFPYDIQAWIVEQPGINPELFIDRIGFQKYPIRQATNGDYAQPDEFLLTLETGEPYQIKMIWAQANDFLTCMGQQQNRLYKAFDNVEFFVVSDVVMQPTAMAFADLFLPAAYGPERFGVRDWMGTPTRSMTQACEPYGDCRSDEQQLFELGKRLAPERFPGNNTYEYMDYLARHANTETFPGGKVYGLDELREKVLVYPERNYRRYETGGLRKDGKPGFETPTGRIEFYSRVYESLGLDPLPWYEEPPSSPVSTPELFEEYPYVLSTGRRTWEFFHAEHRQLKSMREFHPDPLFDISPEDAEREGIEEGDWVWLENQYGKAKFRASIKEGVLPGTLNCEHAWWFPERDPEDDGVTGPYGSFESNANQLTSQCLVGPSSFGAPTKSQICKIYKAS